MELSKTAITLENMITKFGKLSTEMEELIKSEEIPKAERDYQIAKEKAWAVMKAQGKLVGEITATVKGVCSKEMFRRDCSLYRYNGLKVRIDILGKQMNACQSINKNFDYTKTMPENS